MNRLLLPIAFILTQLPLPAQGLDPALLTRPATDAWPTHNGDYSGRRFSTLDQINQSNVKHMQLAWVYRAVVEKAKWLDEREFAELWSMSAILPGATSTNVATMLGYRLGGLPGAASAR